MSHLGDSGKDRAKQSSSAKSNRESAARYILQRPSKVAKPTKTTSPMAKDDAWKPVPIQVRYPEGIHSIASANPTKYPALWGDKQPHHTPKAELHISMNVIIATKHINTRNIQGVCATRITSC